MMDHVRSELTLHHQIFHPRYQRSPHHLHFLDVLCLHHPYHLPEHVDLPLKVEREVDHH
jgi:hypothetical protein